MEKEMTLISAKGKLKGTWGEAVNPIEGMTPLVILAKIGDKDQAYWLKQGDTYADERLQVKAFGSTDVGVSFRVTLADKVLFHAGDLNNWHWKDESTPQEVAGAEKMYLHELELLARETPHIDLALFPIDPRLGSDFMRGAAQFVERLHPDLLVPMHFWKRPDEIRAFQPIADAHRCQFRLLSQPGMYVEHIL